MATPSAETVSLEELLSQIQGSNTSQKSLRDGEDSYQQDKRFCLLRLHPLELGHHRFDLSPTRTTFGRDAECDVVLNDRSVSRNHAIIERIRSLYVISDLGSTNGTHVNGKHIEARPLANGDRVRLGDQIFKFMDADGIETQYHEQMFDNMSRDGLTGAFNKPYFAQSLERRVLGSSQDQHDVSIALIDIDHFKAINDTHGHIAGDEVLQELVRRITEALRGNDILARFGGEEFAVLVDQESEIYETAECCRSVVESAPFDTRVGPVPVTISVGAATRNGQFKTDDLLSACDDALYAAKDSGRNQVCFAG